MKRILAFILCLVLCLPLFVSKNDKVRANGNIVSIADDTKFGKPNFSGITTTSASEVEGVIQKVFNYYTQNYFTYSWNWTDATFQAGVVEAFKATGNMDYYDHAYAYGESYSWESNYGNLDVYHGTCLDDIASTMVYCMLHELSPADYKLEGVIKQMDWLMIHGLLDYSWVDEIFMVGLTHSYLSKVTGDSKYSQNELSSYMFFRDEFYDTNECLWYRDAKYIYGVNNPLASTEYDKKVFWGRGNAWVYVSLAQRLEYMDKNDPAYQVLLHDFISLSHGLTLVQREDGMWNPNLGDPNYCSGKEMTGSGGFLYGMCQGIRLGILDPIKYIPVVTKAYNTMVNTCITEEGLAGYCQPVGWNPGGYTGEDDMKTSTNSFGVGLVLMGLSQYMRICSDFQGATTSVEVKEFDASKAYLTPDKNWYKGLMTASTTASCESGNGVQNLINGNFRRDSVGARFTAYGLKTTPVTVIIDLYEKIDLKGVAFGPYSNRAYKMILEAEVDGTWVKVLDLTQTRYKESYLHKFSFESVKTQKIRLIASGCWTENTDYFSMREMLIYAN